MTFIAQIKQKDKLFKYNGNVRANTCKTGKGYYMSKQVISQST